jgi:hypothetical protein
MLDPMTENDDGIYLRKSRIDRSVGYLIAGVVVLLFFLLTVMGMGRIQQLSDDAGASKPAIPEKKVSEIGGTAATGLQD